MKISMFGMDVDGVLTDGGIYYGSGGMEIKRFHVHDGMGITLLRKAGIVPFIITARTSSATGKRAQELGVTELHQGVRDKLACLEKLVARHNTPMDEIAYVGDDLSDLAVLLRVGLPIAVANATDEVKRVAKFVTSLGGGQGAVREACEYVLKMGGHRDSLSALLGQEQGGGKDCA